MHHDATIRSALRWSSATLPAEPATGTLALRHATVVGEHDGPTVTITCGIHGDEGPWPCSTRSSSRSPACAGGWPRRCSRSCAVATC